VVFTGFPSAPVPVETCVRVLPSAAMVVRVVVVTFPFGPQVLERVVALPNSPACCERLVLARHGGLVALREAGWSKEKAKKGIGRHSLSSAD